MWNELRTETQTQTQEEAISQWVNFPSKWNVPNKNDYDVDTDSDDNEFVEPKQRGNEAAEAALRVEDEFGSNCLGHIQLRCAFSAVRTCRGRVSWPSRQSTK